MPVEKKIIPAKKETIQQKRAKLVRTNHIDEYDPEGFKQQQLAIQQKRFVIKELDCSKKEN